METPNHFLTSHKVKPLFVRLCCAAQWGHTSSYKLITGLSLLTQPVKWLTADPSVGAVHMQLALAQLHISTFRGTHTSLQMRTEMNEQVGKHAGNCV